MQQPPVDHKHGYREFQKDGQMFLPQMALTPGESSLPEPSLLVEEEVPENLGCKWRVLYPFELPEVRFPTDTILPNQRRFA